MKRSALVTTLMSLCIGALAIAQTPLFERLDADKNGVISRNEFETFFNTRGPIGNAAEVFARLDANGDGVLSKQEFEHGTSVDPAFSPPPGGGGGVATGGPFRATPPPPPRPRFGDRASGSGATAAATVSRSIRASRLFAGPREYPPADFAAYGIVAFRSVATAENRDRYTAICEGFMAAIPSAADLAAHGVRLGDQMTTVWPLDDQTLARTMNGARASVPENGCESVTSAIDLDASLNGINLAKQSHPRANLDRDGPYLLAWSPSSTMGQPDVLVLAWDMTDITTAALATQMFADWAVEIELDPTVWRGGWDEGSLRIKLRLWADKYGTEVLRALGSLGGGD